MENKKLLKFLLKDITEIEELLVEKGSSGFDAFEIEFIQSRFKGAKQIIQILDEKEMEGAKPADSQLETKSNLQQEETRSELILEEKEEINSDISKEAEVKAEEISVAEEKVELFEEKIIEKVVAEADVKEEEIQQPEIGEQPKEPILNQEAQSYSDEMELEEEQEESMSRTIGDSFLKEKSVNDLMGNGTGKLENKLSNSPVSSIQGAIGINDRYQYIRELFNGSADTFTKTVSELDQLETIQEAVSYLQQNYKWKKTETSLKFVNLVKRRFPNG